MLLTIIGETVRAHKIWKHTFMKSCKRYFLRSQWEPNMCPILCPQYITRRGRDRDLPGALVSNPGNVKDIFSTPVQTGTGAHPASYTIGTVSLSQRWSGWGVALANYTNLAPWSRISSAVPLLSLCASHDTLSCDSYLYTWGDSHLYTWQEDSAWCQTFSRKCGSGLEIALHSRYFELFFFKRFISQTVYTVCTKINYKIVPVTNLNKYLHYGTIICI